MRVAYADSLRGVWATALGLSGCALIAALLTKRLALTTERHDDYGIKDRVLSSVEVRAEEGKHVGTVEEFDNVEAILFSLGICQEK